MERLEILCCFLELETRLSEYIPVFQSPQEQSACRWQLRGRRVARMIIKSSLAWLNSEGSLAPGEMRESGRAQRGNLPCALGSLRGSEPRGPQTDAALIKTLSHARTKTSTGQTHASNYGAAEFGSLSLFNYLLHCSAYFYLCFCYKFINKNCGLCVPVLHC